MKTHISHSLEETEKIAAEWLKVTAEKAGNDLAAAEASEMTEATVVGLSGHLGAGKTAFVKAIAKILGVVETVTSPTFVIMKAYSREVKPNEDEPFFAGTPWARLIHIDAYRLERPQELEVLDFERLVADPRNLIMIEWPENVGLGKVIGGYKQIDFEIRDGEYQVAFYN